VASFVLTLVAGVDPKKNSP